MPKQPKAKVHRRIRFFQLFLLLGVVVNGLAYVSVYGLTHHKSPGSLGFGLPRPVNSKRPTDLGLQYVTQRVPIHRSEWVETWFIPAQRAPAQGTILLFPGKGGSKKQLLASARTFHALGYDTSLVDFRGVGGSSGHTTTIGVREAEDVAMVMRHAQQRNLQRPLVLYGVSMGSAAILRAIAQAQIQPDALILELPFARLLQTVKSRFQFFHLPPSPAAELFVFWGSIQHGFNGFAHNPVAYAAQVNCPTLVFQGQRDQWTTLTEVQELVRHLRGPKQLVVFPTAKHQLLVTVDPERWTQSVDRFLATVQK